jgi:hypothetical protein
LARYANTHTAADFIPGTAYSAAKLSMGFLAKLHAKAFSLEMKIA